MYFVSIDEMVLWYIVGISSFYRWWCHQMETFSALLDLRAGTSQATSEFPSEGLVTWGVGVFFDLRFNKRLSKQSRRRWFKKISCSLWRNCNDRRKKKTCIQMVYQMSFFSVIFNYIHVSCRWIYRGLYYITLLGSIQYFWIINPDCSKQFVYPFFLGTLFYRNTFRRCDWK